MAEQPIKGTDIIESGMFNEAVKQADNFIAKLSELETGIKSNLQSSKEYLTTWKAQGSETLNTQAKATAEVTKELKQLEQLEQQRIKTEIAKNNLLQANEKAVLAQIKNEQALQKAIDAETKANEASVKALSKKNNELTQAKKQLKELSDRVELNTFKIKQNALADTESGRSRARTAKLVAEEQKKLYQTITEVEQGAGRFGRQVGNYKTAFDGLGNSVNQLTREFPAFAVSAQTGILAISNNLPIFFDEIKKVNAQNAELIKQGKPTESAFKKIGSAIFSVTGLLSIGVTLLTLYAKEIFEFVEALFEGEKALESMTKANDEYNKSINKTKEDIADLKIDLKVRTKLLNQEQGNLLKNENARNKAITENKILRKQSVDALKEELKLTDEIISNYGKTRRVVTQGGEVNEIGVLSASETKSVERYKNELNNINNLFKTNNEYINEQYNIKGKLVKVDANDLKNKKELIDLSDRIRRLQLDEIKDDKFREEQIAIFEANKSKREVDALKNLKKEGQRNELKLEIENELQRKLAEISSKYEKIETDKQTEVTNKILENEKKTNDAIFKIKTDNADFEIYQLEEKYKEEEAKGVKANKDELIRLRNLINERKALLIQAKADEDKLKTENEAEQVKIQNEADIEIAKLKDANLKSIEDKDKKAKEAELQRQNDFNQKLIDAFAKAEAEKSKIKQDALQRDINETEKNIDRQRKLADEGKANSLAFEEKEKARKQVELEREKEQEIKRQKAIAIFKAFTSYMEKGDDAVTAIAKAVGSIAVVDSIAGAFFTGTEKVEDDLKGNKLHNGRDGYRIAVDGSERILTGEQNKKVGTLSNEELATLANDYNNGLLDTAKYAVIQKDFATNVKESVMLMQMANLNKQVESLTNVIKSRPISNFEFDGYGDFIKTTIENGFTKRTTFKQNKPKI